ncbi:MAG: D-3-phosphoglycerate dehydrogenase [Candidatus Magnetoglobus multicellularis str. Araruama]|uniref:D-3-phosphoglycerate dehydrogenase n=1 Tax=Candidatus Magnetoglobus multicellularis str. Araruama TaxID=890399 RepID=A0A1V1NV06_9BACT|nr:MAG: D-3-phosphoglycerate dehydrogenase [Candidatus Magnetoglobus multicellularis str. Araruama]
MGLIGLGAIGMLVANDATALGMKVYGYDPFISINNAWQLSRKVKKADSLETLLTKADYISLHAPLNDKTKGMINKEKLALIKDNAKLLNFFKRRFS